jgi:TolB-like protein/Tfp pilus assembly protein PilF
VWVTSREEKLQTEQSLTFDHYRLDLINAQLWRRKRACALTRQTFAVLRYLVEHAGQMVSKAELFEQLWPGTAVSDGALTFCIVELRKALGDNAKQPKFIETVYRQGYRFLPAVTIPPISSSKFHGSRQNNDQLPDKPSLVVLPFVNMSGDPQQEYFSDGLTEDLTAALSKLTSLFVIARNSAFTYKGKAVKVQDVSTELGVRYVLEGSVRKADNQVRITAQLIDATTGGHLWSERYDRPLQDIFALQDEVVQKIVTTLKLQLTLQEQGILVHKTTDNLAAYDSYLRGREHLNRFTKETNAQARQLFEHAIALDPQYAEAYASLGSTYFREWLWQWSQDSQALEQALALAQKAVALDDSLPRAHTALGWVYLIKKQYDQAIAEGERTIALDANFADAYAQLGDILKFAGRPEEAIGLIEKAMRRNPHYPAYYLFFLGEAYRSTGRYEEAIAAYKKALTRNSNLLPAHANLAVIYSELGRGEEAQAEVAEVLRLNPKYSLEVWRQRAPYKDPAVLERMFAALRKAGLK